MMSAEAGVTLNVDFSGGVFTDTSDRLTPTRRFWVYEAENLLTYHDLIYSDSVEGNWGIGRARTCPRSHN